MNGMTPISSGTLEMFEVYDTLNLSCWIYDDTMPDVFTLASITLELGWDNSFITISDIILRCFPVQFLHNQIYDFE